MKSPEIPRTEESEPNALENEHLKEGVKPIMVCLENITSFEERLHDLRAEGRDYINISFYGNSDYFQRNQMRNSGRETYVISPIDGKDKFSTDYFDCTGLVGSGIKKESGNRVSFLSHQDPYSFLPGGFSPKNFEHDLSETLEELKKVCEEETIDVVLFGGKYKNGRNIKKHYLKSLVVLSLLVKNKLGFLPPVVRGPKTRGPFSDKAFFDNEHGRLHLCMEGPYEAKKYRDFVPTKETVTELKKVWEQDLQEEIED